MEELEGLLSPFLSGVCLLHMCVYIGSYFHIEVFPRPATETSREEFHVGKENLFGR